MGTFCLRIKVIANSRDFIHISSVWTIWQTFLLQEFPDKELLFFANYRHPRYHLSGIAILHAPAVSEITQYRRSLLSNDSLLC